jgi:hypothetical protein
MSGHINAEGVPLRGDGTPFPADPGLWSADERTYLETYYFNAEPQSAIEDEHVATVDVPEIRDDGTAYP